MSKKKNNNFPKILHYFLQKSFKTHKKFTTSPKSHSKKCENHPDLFPPFLFNSIPQKTVGSNEHCSMKAIKSEFN